MKSIRKAVISIPPSTQQFEAQAIRAHHLLARAGFGGTAERAAMIASLDWVLGIGDFTQDPHGGATAAGSGGTPGGETTTGVEIGEARGGTERLGELLGGRGSEWERARSLSQAWLRRMATTDRPLDERLILLWHSHFASGLRTVGSMVWLYEQHEMFRDVGTGWAGQSANFSELAHAIVRDPAMLRFLDNDVSTKGRPNENLARELMELFTLGTGHFTESDVREAARALTGYSISGLTRQFEFHRGDHDEGEKSILGKRGAFDGDDLVRVLLEHPACAEMVAVKLYRHFVADRPGEQSPGGKELIGKVAGVLRENGYAIMPALRVIFESDHFYSPEVMGRMIKSPAHIVAGTIRTLKTPTRDLAVVVDMMERMGQRLFDPPSVAGWEGGRAWLDATALYARQNVAAYLIAGISPMGRPMIREDDAYDPGFLLEGLGATSSVFGGAGRNDARGVAEHVARQVLVVEPGKVLLDELAAYLTKRGDYTSKPTLVRLLLLITASPEYQLC